MTSSSRLDELAEELDREVRHAAGARTDAKVASTLDGRTKELNTLAAQLEQYAAVVAGPSPLEFPTTLTGLLAERRAWVETQTKKVREVVAEDPMRVQQGKLWSDTQRAVTTLRDDLASAIDDAYSQLLGPFRGDDRDLLDALPPGIPGTAEYRETIDEFERLAEARPTRPEDVAHAAAVGRRLRRHREEVEAQAVPTEFADQWRLVRTTGLPLAEMTDAFSAWLRDRGFASSTVVTFRGR